MRFRVALYLAISFIFFFHSTVWTKEIEPQEEPPAGSAAAIQSAILRFLGVDPREQSIVLVEEDGPAKFLTLGALGLTSVTDNTFFAEMLPELVYLRADPGHDSWSVKSLNADGYRTDWNLGGGYTEKRSVEAMTVGAKLSRVSNGIDEVEAEFRGINATSDTGDDILDRKAGKAGLSAQLRGERAGPTTVSILSDFKSNTWRKGAMIESTELASFSMRIKLDGDFGSIRKKIAAGYSWKQSLFDAASGDLAAALAASLVQIPNPRLPSHDPPYATPTNRIEPENTLNHEFLEAATLYIQPVYATFYFRQTRQFQFAPSLRITSLCGN